MKVTRVFSDEHGETHFAEREFPLHDGGKIGRLSDSLPAKSVIFRENDPDYDYDWHNAPDFQLIVLLDGAIEIQVSDGERREFRGGDILVMEDTTGKGHKTRHLEPRKRRSLFIILS